VAWFEGMFLQPQHLQQIESGADVRLTGQLRLIDPLHWGIAELAIDEDALCQHQIAIRRLTAVLPCGTLLRFPGDARLDVRSFDPSLPRVRVYIGLRQCRAGELAALHEDERGAPVRFRIRRTPVEDLCQADEPVDLPLLVPDVRILLVGDAGELDGYDRLRLLEIEATGSSVHPFRIRPELVPPLLHVQAWPPLHERIESLRIQMAGRAAALAARAPGGPADVQRALLALVLARAASALAHRLALPAHPRDVYELLLDAAVSLDLIGGAAQPVALPPYDHDDLHGCFAAVLEIVQRGLTREFRDGAREYLLAFSSEHDAYVAADLGPDAIDRRNAFYLAVRADLPAAELVRLVATEGKVGSAAGVRFLTTLAVAGLRVEPLVAPPLEVPARAGSVFFRIDPASQISQWQRVREEGSLGVHLGKLDGAEVRLFIVAAEE
jgi:type VI secretion system protein ImpJ